jgi:hypothetical protein
MYYVNNDIIIRFRRLLICYVIILVNHLQPIHFRTWSNAAFSCPVFGSKNIETRSNFKRVVEKLNTFRTNSETRLKVYKVSRLRRGLQRGGDKVTINLYLIKLKAAEQNLKLWCRYTNLQRSIYYYLRSEQQIRITTVDG